MSGRLHRSDIPVNSGSRRDPNLARTAPTAQNVAPARKGGVGLPWAHDMLRREDPVVELVLRHLLGARVGISRQHRCHRGSPPGAVR